MFEVEVHDGVDLISRGKHERFIIDKAKFDAKMKEKVKNKGALPARQADAGKP